MSQNWSDPLHRLVQNKQLSAQACELLVRYVDLLVDWNRVHNLSGLKTHEGMIEQLVIPSLALADSLGSFSHCLDLGSGAGIPGMILAIHQPNQRWTLIEKSRKKTRFLMHVRQTLTLKNVQIVCQEFTQISVDNSVDAIVSRGSAKLNEQIRITKPWRDHGIVLYSIQTQHSMRKLTEVARTQTLEEIPIDGVKGLMLVKVH